MIKKQLKKNILSLKHVINARPKLKMKIMSILNQFPKFKNKIIMIKPNDSYKRSIFKNENLDELSVTTRMIYSDLKIAISNIQRESK